MAGCIIHHWQDHIDHHWPAWPLPESLAPFHVPLDPYYDFAMGAGYAHGADVRD